MRRYAPLLLIALVGCKPNPGSYLKVAPPEPLPAGWRVHLKPSAGFSLGLPSSYEAMDLSQLSEKGSPSPGTGFSLLLGAPSKPEPGTETFAAAVFEGSTLGGVMVIQKDHKHNVSRGREAAELEERLSRGAMKIVNRSEMDLPVGKASRIVAEFGRNGVSFRVTGYVLVDGHYSYRAIFLGLSTDGTKLPTKQIMRTFRANKMSPRT